MMPFIALSWASILNRSPRSRSWPHGPTLHFFLLGGRSARRGCSAPAIYRIRKLGALADRNFVRSLCVHRDRDARHCRLARRLGAAMPLLAVLASPPDIIIPIVTAASLAFLALLGAVGATAGGANVIRATARVTFWGALAIALTAGIGAMVGAKI